MITYKPAGTDIFKEQTESIVNAVNCQGISGAGIAYYVSLKFPKETKVYERMCKDRAIAPGIIGVIPAEPNSENTNIKYIFALPTIGTFQDFNDLDYAGKLNLVRIGVEDLRRVLLTMPELKSVSIPALGCGVAGLKWGNVKPIIEEFLSDVPQEVFVIEPRDKGEEDEEEYDDEYDEEYDDEEEDEEISTTTNRYNQGWRNAMGDKNQIFLF